MRSLWAFTEAMAMEAVGAALEVKAKIECHFKGHVPKDTMHVVYPFKWCDRCGKRRI